MPTLNFSGKLNYHKCAALYAKARDKSKGKALHGSTHYYIRYDSHSHPITHKWERAYSLRMYQTDILIYWADGTIYVDGYNSPTTSQVLNDYGPVRIWSNSSLPTNTTRRFGSWSANGNKGWPVDGGIYISPAGVVHGLKDTFRRVKPSKLKERRAIGAKFRLAATGRIVLGEFPATKRDSAGGWQAVVPKGHAKDDAFVLLMGEADHGKIWPLFASGEPTARLFGRKHVNYPTQESAATAVVDNLLRHHLADRYNSPYFEDHVVTYPPVQVL